MKIKKPVTLIIAIIICQMAGIIGAFFTTSAIPTWYVTLTKPDFNPPSWLFGPVWTLLYTLMGISVYKIWLKDPKKKEVGFAIKIFAIQLFLNSIWSMIFFGAKNLGLAFVEIVILWAVIIYTTKLFWKIDKSAGILLLPYIAWVSFAMILNLSIWTLNPKVSDAYAQDFNYEQSYSDYNFTKDKYNTNLDDYNKKKDSYLKNPTLSLKEELRLSLYSLLLSRNDLITTYLTTLRMKVLESKGLNEEEKNNIISKISEEFKWYQEYRKEYNQADSLERLIEKSQNEDERFKSNSTPSINYTLVMISYGEVSEQQKIHQDIYDSLKNETKQLVELGRADSSLFERWYLDIEGEFNTLRDSLEVSKNSSDALNSAETYAQKKGFSDSIESLSPAKASLLKINSYLYEFENVIEGKR